jgi:hypothetical protein
MSRPCLKTSVAALASSLLALCLTGCLVSETEEERATLGDDGVRGDYTLVMRNIQSDGATPHHQDQDFQLLLDVWQSDSYLLDRVRQGVYVRRRALTVEDGVLVGREDGLFSNPSNIALFVAPDSSIRRPIPRSNRVTSTNGKVVDMGDTIYVLWPPRTREFTVKMQPLKFQHTSNLVARFKAWTRKH